MSKTCKRISSALLSGNATALFAMSLMAAKPFCQLLDRMLPERAQSSFITPRIALIVGPPRSGSTLIFQSLAYFLPCAYPSNQHTLFPRHIGGGLPASSPKPTLKSYYGHSPARHGVNEFNEFFEKLYSLQDTVAIRSEFLKGIQRTSPHGHPVLLKNVSAYLAVRKLTEAIPELHIIRVVRDELPNARSMLNAYEEIGWFNPVPLQLKSKSPETDPAAFAINALRLLNAEIDQQLTNVDQARITEIRYEDFLKTPVESATRIASMALGLDPASLRLDRLRAALIASEPHSQDPAQKQRQLEQIQMAARKQDQRTDAYT